MLIAQKNVLISFIVGYFIQHTISAQTVWNINGAHSNINFAIQWEEFAFRTGEFKLFGGKLEAPNTQNLDNAKVQLQIMVNGIDLIADRLSKMVQNEEYLDSARCPMITFTCEQLKKKKKQVYTANGTLTVRCVPQQVVFEVNLLGIKENYAALRVTGELKKSMFGITGGGQRLGEKILITSYFELNRKKNTD